MTDTAEGRARPPRHYMTGTGESGVEHDLRRLRALYRALGDTTRLRIIGLLAEIGPMPVNELSARVAVSQPLISWHLRILRLAGLIETERHGRAVICRLRRATFEELRAAESRLIAGGSGVSDAVTAPERVPDVG
jgi:ArsR family transcriptional regulator